jgi:photosystem II stability/assembly factor-like uncharacterized protein
MSADGHELAAAGLNSTIYQSTNSGFTWNPSIAPSGYWNSVAMSADGTKLIAAMSQGPVYVSTNSGNNWTPVVLPSLPFWGGVASSSDGSSLAAVGTAIYTWQYAPALACTNSNGTAIVSWPDSVYTNIFTLQTNGDLTTANWADAGLPVNDDGTNKSVTITPPPTNLFFRLVE